MAFVTTGDSLTVVRFFPNCMLKARSFFFPLLVTINPVFRLAIRSLPSTLTDGSTTGLRAETRRHLERFYRIADAPPDVHPFAVADPAVSFMAIHGLQQGLAA